MAQQLYIDTPLGQMLAIGDNQALYLLQFTDCPNLKRKIKKLTQTNKAPITTGYAESLESIKKELGLYFEGKLQKFKTPVALSGTPFQKQVWQTLTNIPTGQTYSYAQLAEAIGRPSSCRAVAQANATNKLALIIPCHRVINKNGSLGGYAGHVHRKQWLLGHERRHG